MNAVATDATMIQKLTKELSSLQSQLETKKNLEVMLETKKNVEVGNGFMMLLALKSYKKFKFITIHLELIEWRRSSVVCKIRMLF